MKAGINWSVRGLDDETRKAALEAARQSGMTLNEWIDHAIAERAAEANLRRDAERDELAERLDGELNAVAGSVARLTRRVRAMDATARSAIPGLTLRLDEIQAELDRLQSEPAGASHPKAIRAVAGMVERLARDLDDADEAARAMIEGLRRTTRPPVAEPPRPRSALPPSPPARSPQAGERFEELRQRLDALLARSATPLTPPPATAALDSTLRALEGRIDDARSRTPRADLGPLPLSFSEDEQMRRIEARLADITGHLAKDEPPPAPPKAAAATHEPFDLGAVITEALARQREADMAAAREVRAAEREAADKADAIDREIAEALANLRQQVGDLGSQIGGLVNLEETGQSVHAALAERIEALAAEAPQDRELLDDLRAEVAELREFIELSAREATLLDRFDELSRRIPDRGRLDALGEEVSALRRALEADDSPKAITRLEMRVSELARSVEATLSTRHAAIEIANAGVAASLADIRGAVDDLALATRHADGDTVAIAGLAATLADIREALHSRAADPIPRAEVDAIGRLDERLDTIALRIEELAARALPTGVVDGLEERLEALAARVEDIDEHATAQAFDELKAEVATIRADIAERTPPRLAEIESEVRELAGRLDHASRDTTDPAQLADLEQRVAALAAELEHATPRGATLAQVEADLARLQDHLVDNRKESLAAARIAARDAVRELGREGTGDLVRSLQRDLAQIREAAGSSDQYTQSTLQALHATLASVIERLAKVESDRTRALAEAAAKPASAAPEPMPAAPAPIAARSERHEEAPPSRPDLAALREIAANPSEPDRRFGDRRAEFIAAARRAAQAAVAETGGPSEPAEDAPEKAPGAFARIGHAIRNRQKSFLLAAAAVILAIATIQVLGPARKGPDSVATAAETKAGAPAAAKTRAIAKPAPVAAAAPVVADTDTDNAALVAPAADAKAAMALAAPDAVGNRFGDAFSAVDRPEAPAEAAEPEVAATALPDAPADSPATTGALPGLIGSDKLQAAAKVGDPSAAYEIGTRYAEGRGVDTSLANAALWYQRAAEAGLALAQYRLASLYERGQGVDKSLSTAVKWYQRAADQGNVGAMHNLAVLMSEGADGPPDHQKALEWFLAAANYGIKDSQYNLGVIFARGLGRSPDLVESYKWFAIAAAAGDTDAAARRDEVAAMLSPDDLARAKAAVEGWRAKPTLPEANTVAAPDGGWEGAADSITDADRKLLVRKIQTLLAEQGYDPGPPDGFEGPKTREAVRAFQRTIGVADTGLIDTDLASALAGRSS